MSESQGEFIKAARKKADMTQEELAKLLGLTKATINKYEKGTIKNIPLEIRITICKNFGVNFWDLLNNQELAEYGSIPIDEIKDIERLRNAWFRNITIGVDRGKYSHVVETSHYLCLDKRWFNSTLNSIKDFIRFSSEQETKNIEIKQPPKEE